MFATYDYQPVELYQNDGNFNFIEVSDEAGFPNHDFRYYGFCWGDYDKDGLLDVYISVYWDPTFGQTFDHENHLYRNNGDGTFEDVTAVTQVNEGYTSTLAPIWLDYDNDGDADLYVVNDKWMANTMFRNDGNGVFTDVSEFSQTDIVVDGMTATVGDCDHDGYDDIYVTNTPEGNVLLMGDESGVFNDVTEEAGVVTNEMCWGATWIDADLDTDLDLYVTTQGGFSGGVYTGQQNYYYENDGTGLFTESHNTVGLAMDDAHTHCVAKGDLNRDGWPDFAISSIDPFICEVWQNVGQGSNNSVGFSLEGTESNRDAIGSWIHVYAAGQKWSTYTHSQENYLSQNSQRKIFGLGTISELDSVVVHWPNGLVQNFGALPINQYHHLVEGNVAIDVIPSSGENLICQNGVLELSTNLEYLSYEWSTGDTTASIIINSPGEYFVTLELEPGEFQESLPFVVDYYPDFSWSAFSIQPSCYGAENGIISFNPAGQSGSYSNFQWTNGSGSYVSADLLVDSVYAGTYNYEFTDQYGCDWGGQIQLGQPSAIEVEIDTHGVSCFGESDGWIEMSMSGGKGELTHDLEAMNDLVAGEYEVTIIDSTGCEILETFSIEQPDVLTIQLNGIDISDSTEGEGTVIVDGGTPPYVIEWSNGSAEATIEDLDEGSYSVVVTDSLGCMAEGSITITGIWIDKLGQITVFPNPMETEINLTFEKPLDRSSNVYLINSQGQYVYTASLNAGIQSAKIDVNNLASGIYLLRFEMGEQALEQRLLKR